MSSNALTSQGMQISRGDGASPEVFTAIPDVKSIQGPGGTANIIDLSDLNSTFREKRPGLQDEGQLTLTINYIPQNAQHAGLRADRAAQVRRTFQLTFTDSPATVWQFAAYVSGFSVTNSVDAVTEAQVTLEIDGAITEL